MVDIMVYDMVIMWLMMVDNGKIMGRSGGFQLVMGVPFNSWMV